MPSLNALLSEAKGWLEKAGTKLGTTGITGPEMFTAQEARDRFGIELPAEDYMLKLTPDVTGLVVSYITPTDYEFHSDNTITTPEGQRLSFEEFQKQQTEQALIERPLASDERLLYGDYQRTGGQLSETEWLNQGTPLRPGAEKGPDYEYQQLRDIFGRVFPQQDLETVLNFAATDPEGFGGEIFKAGRTPDTEALLRKLFPGITTEQVDSLFTPQSGAVTLTTSDGQSIEAVLNPDYTVWYQGQKVGSVDPDTGSFTPDTSALQPVDDINLAGDQLVRAFAEFSAPHHDPKFNPADEAKTAVTTSWNLGWAIVGALQSWAGKYIDRPFETAVLEARVTAQVQIGWGDDADRYVLQRLAEIRQKYGYMGSFISPDVGELRSEYLTSFSNVRVGPVSLPHPGKVFIEASDFVNPVYMIPIGPSFGKLAKYTRKVPVLGDVALGLALTTEAMEQAPGALLKLGIKGTGVDLALAAGARRVGQHLAKQNIKRARAFLMEIPETEKIINGVLVDNWQRRVLKRAAKVDIVRRGIEKGLGYRIVVDRVGNAVKDVVGRGAVAWNEIYRMGINAASLKVMELRAIGENAVKLFGFDEKGFSKELKLRPGYESERAAAGTLEHVFTHPEMYYLSAKQAAYVQRVKEINQIITAMLQREGVAPEHVIEDWIHRVVTGGAKKGGGKRVGAKQPYEKPRQFKTMAEGIQYFLDHPELGARYANNPELAIGEYIREAFKKIADARLEKYIDEFGESPLERLNQRYPGLQDRAKAARQALTDATDFHNAVVRAARGERLPEATLRRFERRFPELGRELRALVTASDADAVKVKQLLVENQKTIVDLKAQIKALKEGRPEPAVRTQIVEITDIEIHVNDKYSELPNIEPETAYSDLADDVYTQSVTPEELERQFNDLSPAEQKAQLPVIETAINNMTGDLIETYRYESFAEGQAFEKKIDRYLAVTESYRIKMGEKPLVKDFSVFNGKAKPKPVVLPAEEKIRQAFEVMSWDERNVLRQSMDSQLIEIGQLSMEQAAEIEAILEALKADRLYNFRIGTVTKSGKMRQRSLLSYFWNKEGSFPEHFTVKQAEEITGRPVTTPSFRQKNRVPREAVLDADWAREMGFNSPDEVLDHLNQLRDMRHRLDDLTEFQKMMADREKSIKKMAEIMDSVNSTPRNIVDEPGFVYDAGGPGGTGASPSGSVAEPEFVYDAGGPGRTGGSPRESVGEPEFVYDAGGPENAGVSSSPLWREPEFEPIPDAERESILDQVYKEVTADVGAHRITPCFVGGKPVDLRDTLDIRRAKNSIEVYVNKRWRKVDEHGLQRWAAMYGLTPPPAEWRPAAAAHGTAPEGVASPKRRYDPQTSFEQKPLDMTNAGEKPGKVLEPGEKPEKVPGSSDEKIPESRERPGETSGEKPDKAPEGTQEPLPRQIEGTPEAGLQVDMFGNTHWYAPEGRGEVVQMSFDDYQKLADTYEREGKAMPGSVVRPKVEGISELSRESEYGRFTPEVPTEPALTAEERAKRFAALQKEAKAMEQGAKGPYYQARSERTAALAKVRQPSLGEGYIMQPFASGKIYSQEFIDSFNHFFGHQGGSAVLKVTSDVSGILRLAEASLDFSAMMIQGLLPFGLAATYMGTNPKIGVKLMGAWFKAFGYQVGAFFSPGILYKYMAKNEAAITKRISFGGTSRAIDYFEILGSEGGLGGLFNKVTNKIPFKPYQRAEISFHAATEVVRNEFWNILSENAIKNGKEFELARVLDLMTGIADSAAAGVPLGVRQFESSFMWFAPNYTRACMTLIADVFRGGYTGAMARRMLGGLVTVGPMMYAGTQFAISLASGKSPEEAWNDVLEGFCVETDPITGETTWNMTANFMTIEVGNQRFGIGGFWYSMMRLVGKIVDTITDPSKRIDLVTILKGGKPNMDNPFIYSWYTRTSPLVRTGMELWAGRDFLGYPIETAADYGKYIGKSLEPIWAEGGLNWLIPGMARDNEIPEGVAAKIITPVGQLFGLRNFPESAWTEFYDKASEYIKRIPQEELDPKQTQAWKEGKLGWQQLTEIQQTNLLMRYGDLSELYEAAQGDSAVRDSSEWASWSGRIDQEREVYYERLTELGELLSSGQITPADYRAMGSEAGQNYGAAMDSMERDPAYKDIYDYLDTRNASGQKYNYEDDIALGEYQSTILYADLLDSNGSYDWDERDKRTADFIDKWGPDVYDRIQTYLSDQKNLKGLDPVWLRRSQDSGKLSEYWQLPYREIKDMDAQDEANSEIPAEYYSLWKDYQTAADKQAFLDANPDLAKDWRTEYRAVHPEVDAMLALWGYAGKLQSIEAYNLLQKEVGELGIALPKGLPPRKLSKSYFDYNKLVAEKGASSARAKLYRLDNPDWEAWGEENLGWKPLTDDPDNVRLTVKMEPVYEKYQALRTADGKADSAARLDFRRANPEFEQWGEANLGWKPLTGGASSGSKTGTTTPDDHSDLLDRAAGLNE